MLDRGAECTEAAKRAEIARQTKLTTKGSITKYPQASAETNAQNVWSIVGVRPANYASKAGH